MKIIVMSDTHGKYDRVDDVVKKNKDDAALFIHLGDGAGEAWRVSQGYTDVDFKLVKGNCDLANSDIDCPDNRVVEIAGHRIFCAHGHMYNVYSGLDTIAAAARNEDCDIALYGHTHVSLTEFYNGVYIMNPGSLSSPRTGGRASYGIIELSENDNKVGMDIIGYTQIGYTQK
ncbi:MAG: metallophosphoesterase [Oscillospiraceae bacterium]|nr:metallophosphoesterase [Oscillospiraceae bacterium]